MAKQKQRVHFMGIGGAGMSAVAQIAHHQGYQVSGCDLQDSTPYIDKVKKLGVQVEVGHDVSHLKDIDILAVTPAAFFQSSQHPELVEAKNKGILLTGQQFMGQYLQKNKKVICISGAHGKSTTTAMTGVVLEAAKLDPTVEAGATVIDWQNNVRIGNGDYFVCEADEYYHNFLAYHSDVIILTMIELDHPEYFESLEKIIQAYRDFILQLKPGGVLIYNSDDEQNRKLVASLPGSIARIPYSASDLAQNIQLKLMGEHNRANAAAVLKLAQHLNINEKLAAKTLSDFSGTKRRLELIGEKGNILVFDDYANHPTSYQATIQAVKQMYPKYKLIAVIEPHTYSRPKATLDQYPQAFASADQVIVSQIFASREEDPGDFSGADIAEKIGVKAVYIPDFEDITNKLQEVEPSTVILVMGSGDSYKLARQILAKL